MGNMTRRDFGIKAGALLAGRFLLAGTVAGASTLISGCSGVAGDIEHWVPVGLAAFNTIVSLLEGAGIINPIAGAPITAIIGLVTAGFGQIVLAVQEYAALIPPPATAVAKVKAALGLVVSNFQQFLTSINVTDNKLLQLVVGFAGLILGTISGFENQLPASIMVMYGANVVGRTARVGSNVSFAVIQRRGHQLSRLGFKQDWNKFCDKNNAPKSKFHLNFVEAHI